ncbi:MAG TPA: aminotransferase class I/II-fold pyridoxal phosphate-dependent enzyme [bacterium]|nr:aminotransferase class I/II-fold pyridoxal phosphate-dependent enzyme [bacterium]HPO07302.1 aminotransferase class I/II-fold pyridoxal phosphate-dependent enzyme [bacterium]HQP97973.1 aminotransferase class I/II-fold pyridoxal phosphate-dependent enzyme [bacterium]
MNEPHSKRQISRICVHEGEERYNPYDAITTPIVQTSTFIFKSTDAIEGYTCRGEAHYEYTRYGNPTQTAAQKKLAALEGAESALLFSSGMSAVTTTLLCLLQSGDHIIITDDAYKKSLEFCKYVLPQYGIGFDIVSVHDYDAMEKAIRPNTRIFFSESPTNPYLNIMDLERLAKMLKGTKVLLLCDSTFASPYNMQPLEFGVDLVIHSCTKYLGGHNDLLAGVVMGRTALIEEILKFHKILGGIVDPLVGYLLIRGLKTFDVRMQRLNDNGMQVAQFLENHPRVQRVYYPGLPSHPHHEIAKRHMTGFGAVVSFEMDADLEGTKRFLDQLKLFRIGPSFGGAESLITHPASVSYYDCTRDERIGLGIKDNLIRLAAGIEEAEAIIGDLEQAFAASA